MGQLGGVWLVIGIQAAGKSSVADALARRFELGVHVRGGQFYRWAVRGWSHPASDGDANPDVRNHLDLRYRLSASVADQYAEAGFTTVVQDNLFGSDVTTWLGQVRARPLHLVVLCPRVEVVALRDQARKAATGKVAYADGGFTIAGLDMALRSTPRVGLWWDNSDETVEATVDAILARADNALIG